jgi:hypothetical protein
VDNDLNKDRGISILSNVIKLNLFADLKHQLFKDFNRAGIPFPDLEKQEFTFNGASGFLKLVQERLYVLLMEDFNQFLNLMYAVDIPERSFRDFRDLDAVDAAGYAAILLVEREWRKVCYRRGINP